VAVQWAMLPNFRSTAIERRVLALRPDRAYSGAMTSGRTLRAIAHPAAQPSPLRVKLAIGDDLFRIGLARMLADEGVELVSDGPADALLADAAGADPAGAGHVVVLCGPGEDERVEALAAGASAVLWRGCDASVIAAALRSAVAGVLVMPVEMAERTLGAYRDVRARTPRDVRAGGRRAGHAAVDSLSPRERDVLELLAAGRTNDEIADDLFVAASTVKNHVARIMSKLGARNRTHAAVIAVSLVAA
jgi:DNA-binding NarL/FixJ family response regulator